MGAEKNGHSTNGKAQRVALLRARPGSGKIFAETGDSAKAASIEALKRANDFHEDAQKSFKPFLEYAMEAGKYLVQAKALVTSKLNLKWEVWLESRKEFTGSVRTAQGYMQVYENRNELKGKKNLSLRKALHSIAKPKPKASLSPHDAVNQIVMKEIISSALRGWTVEEKKWLGEHVQEVDLPIECKEILRTAFGMVRELVQEAMEAEARP
jgi:hypothetical protein